jgi:hypothetical protein
MAVRDPFWTLTEERQARQPLGLRADFAVYRVRFQLLDENIRRSKSRIENVFPARVRDGVGARKSERLLARRLGSSTRFEVFEAHGPVWSSTKRSIAIQQLRRTAFEIQPNRAGILCRNNGGLRGQRC